MIKRKVGSPPQVRGKRVAGRAKRHDTEDHPRRCGENFCVFMCPPYVYGSPPQVRGKHDLIESGFANNGITPAGAGKTPPHAPVRTRIGDHPRRCGENYFVKPAALRAIGSPPQVRGKRKVSFRKSKALRITPAGAGKTLNKSSIYSKSQDHPRRCGENLTKVNVHTSLLGSPPQVRGKPACRRGSVFLSWITPAGAGKTATVLLAFKAAWDHPRRCGENRAEV